jgi:hypothetical protein
MRNIFFRGEDDNGKQLPSGEFQWRKFGKDSFTITMQVPESEAAWKLLQDLQQVMTYMGDTYTVGDVEKGLRLVGEMESYFTTWRHGPKLVPAGKLEALQRQLDAALEAKRQLQADNDAAST